MISTEPNTSYLNHLQRYQPNTDTLGPVKQNYKVYFWNLNLLLKTRVSMNLRVTAKTLEKSNAESDIRLKATIYIYIGKSGRGKRYVSKKAALSINWVKRAAKLVESVLWIQNTGEFLFGILHERHLLDTCEKINFNNARLNSCLTLGLCLISWSWS